MLPNWLTYELGEKWERLRGRLRLGGLRDWVNEHPAGVVAMAAGSAALLLIVVIAQLVPDRPSPVQAIDKEWYYDLNTGELFVAGKGLTPPIEAPSGPTPDGTPAGVRAYVLSYVYDPNASERFIGFLETTAPEDVTARVPGRAARPSAATEWGRGKLIRRVEDALWVPADTPMGQAIFEEAFAPNENGERPAYCRPD